MNGWVLQKIVSGSQTGVDRGALEAALAHGFPCGGWCPADFQAEDGTIPTKYPVTPLPVRVIGRERERTSRIAMARSLWPHVRSPAGPRSR
jgi:hypothetical protein